MGVLEVCSVVVTCIYVINTLRGIRYESYIKKLNEFDSNMKLQQRAHEQHIMDVYDRVYKIKEQY